MAKRRYRRVDHEQVWEQYAQGRLPAEIGRSMGRGFDGVYFVIRRAGGIRPASRVRSARQLSLADREEISRGIAAGLSCRAIAKGFGAGAVDGHPRADPQRRARRVSGGGCG